MKRTFLFILICLLVNISYSQTYNFTFSTADFSIVENNGKHMIDYPTSFDAVCNTCDPILPSCVKNILLPPNKKVSNYTVTYTTTSWQNNINLEAMPMMFPTSSNGGSNISCAYDLKVYPDSIVRYGGLSTIDRYPYVSFIITPFVYDATNGSLSIVSQVNINIELVNDNITDGIFPTQDRVIKKIVHNPNDIDLFYPKREHETSSMQNIDYLIITLDSLKSSFEPLRVWKTQKGVYTKIVTIEEIDSIYEHQGNTQQLRIKQYIYDLHHSAGLKWVLLGGDDTIVPILKVPMTIGSNYAEIPSDIFYGSFDNAFDWNANGNNILGEESDNIGLTQEVCISRLPINTKSQTRVYINKLLHYEQNPTMTNPSMLLCAQIIADDNYQTYHPQSGFSDAHIKSDILIANSITPYWGGDVFRFYDTGTDFTGGADYDLNTENLTERLNNNYNFLHFATHGGTNYWSLEIGKYYSTNVQSLTNTTPMVVVTMACSTNSFDGNEPCLSEAFIRQPVGGAIAYLGSSRAGWASYGFTKLGPSFSLDEEFFKILFSNQSLNFAEIVQFVKLNFKSTASSNDYYRWILLANNAIGDAELPIYTTIPNKFEHVTFERNGSNLVVNTGDVEGCTITISDIANGGSYYVTDTNTVSATFTDVPGGCTIVITKENYIPYIIEPSCVITTEIIDSPKIVTGCEETRIGGIELIDTEIEARTLGNGIQIPIDSSLIQPIRIGEVKITDTGSLEVINGGTVTIEQLSMEEGSELIIH